MRWTAPSKRTPESLERYEADVFREDPAAARRDGHRDDDLVGLRCRTKTLRSVVRRALTQNSRTEAMERLNAIRHTAGRLSLTSNEEAACWELVRGFSVEEVKAFLAGLPTNVKRPANDALTAMLFFRWRFGRRRMRWGC